MAFNNPTQPGETRYPNMLPVQSYGYPDGSFLALLQLTNPPRLEAVIQEGIEMAMSQVMTQIEAYKQATGPTVVHGAEKELASYLLRKPQLWTMFRDIFPQDCDKEWVRFTLLCERAYKGEFIKDGRIYQPQMVKAIWQVDAMALGVIQSPSQLVGAA